LVVAANLLEILMAGCKIAPGRNLREDGMASSLASSLGAVGSTAPDRVMTIRAGLIGGVIGGVIIWIYEAIVWVGVQHLLPLAGIPRNATGLVFGKAVQEQLGALAYLLGTGIHFFFCLVWGVLFAFLWPSLRRRGWEVTLAAMFYAVVIWIVMHAAIMVASNDHPNYFDPNVVIGGFMSHLFYAVPLALYVKRRLAA
jgi:hypothetical protein